jgi:hypothetical protein
MKKNKKQKGLTDSQLVKKYEGGKLDLTKPLKRLLKTPSNSSILKNQKQA